IWRGATDSDGTPQQNDALLGEQSHLEQTSEIIANNPLAYVKRRFMELANAYLQAHGVAIIGDESLRGLSLNWIRSGFSPSAFQELISADQFLMKFLVYIWHYIALI